MPSITQKHFAYGRDRYVATANTILPGQICSWTDGQCQTVHPGLGHADYENQYTL